MVLVLGLDVTLKAGVMFFIFFNGYLWLGMHDEILHFDIFKKNHGDFEIFQDPFFEIFHEIFNFHFEVTKTFKNMIKVYEVSRKYIMLFMHNNIYLPLTGLLTLYCPKKTSWNFWNISEIFHEIFHEIFQAKKFHEILHHYLWWFA